jgi:hypothetical protein
MQYGMPNSDPKFRALPSERGDAWCVHVIWNPRKTEVVTGFENQYAALEWIRLKAANWVADKIMRDPN